MHTASIAHPLSHVARMLGLPVPRTLAPTNTLGEALPKIKSPSALDKRLRKACRTHDQWAHSMIVSPKGEIDLHNSQVRRRNVRFAIKKGIA